MIGLDDNWDTKGTCGPVCFSHPGAGSDLFFVLLQSDSVSVDYNQILQSYFGEQGGVL